MKNTESKQVISKPIVQKCEDCKYWKAKASLLGKCYVLPKPVDRMYNSLACRYAD